LQIKPSPTSAKPANGSAERRPRWPEPARYRRVRKGNRLIRFSSHHTDNALAGFVTDASRSAGCGWKRISSSKARNEHLKDVASGSKTFECLRTIWSDTYESILSPDWMPRRLSFGEAFKYSTSFAPTLVIGVSHLWRWAVTRFQFFQEPNIEILCRPALIVQEIFGIRVY